MTFLEEEFEAVEKTPHYRRVLKVLLKYQIYNLCQKLSDVGEESYVVTASVSDGTFSRLGSKKGETFLQKVHDAEWKFLSFCSGRGSDDDPQVFEEIPDQSQEEEADQFEQEVVTQTYDDGQDDLEQDPSSYESQEAPIQEMEDSNLQMEVMLRRRGDPFHHGINRSTGYHPSQIPDSICHTITRNVYPGHSDNRVKSENAPDIRSCNPIGSPGLMNTVTETRIKVEPEEDVEGNPVYGQEEGIVLGTDYSREQSSFANFYDSTTFREADNFSISFVEGENPGYTSGITPDRKYRCKLCSKSFKHPTHLKDHMRIHTGIRPYHCTECGKRFTQNSHLTKHLKTHR